MTGWPYIFAIASTFWMGALHVRLRRLNREHVSLSRLNAVMSRRLRLHADERRASMSEDDLRLSGSLAAFVADRFEELSPRESPVGPLGRISRFLRGQHA